MGPGTPLAARIAPAAGLLLLTGLLIPVLTTNNGLPFLFALLGGVGALAIIVRPHWGIMIVLLSSAFALSPVAAQSRFMRIPYLVGVLMMIPFLLGALREGQVRALRYPQVQLLAAIGGLYVISTGISWFHHPPILLPEEDKTEWMLVALLARLAFLVCFVSFVVTRRQIELAAWIMVAVIVLSAMNSLGSISHPEAARRAAADFGYAQNPNRLAFMCLFGTSLIWFYSSSPAGRAVGRFLRPLCLVLPAVTLATGSRNGLLQALAFSVLIVKESTHDARQRVRALFLVGAAVLLVISLVPAALLTRAMSFDPTGAGPGKESLKTRVEQLEAAVTLFAAHPIVGIGIGNFETMAPSAHKMGRGVHNSYLRAATEGGFGTIALYLLLFAVNFRMLTDIERSGPRDIVWLAKGLRIGLVLFLISSLTADAWISDYLYLIIGLTISASSLPTPSPARAFSRRPQPASMEAFAQ